jgi:predicted DNA-binding transcriptional regulator AlpA
MTSGSSNSPFSSGVEPLLESNRDRLLTPTEAADLLRQSLSWLAKSRVRGDGPPYVKLGRSVRYSERALVQWWEARLRLSTNDRTAGKPVRRDRLSRPASDGSPPGIQAVNDASRQSRG